MRITEEIVYLERAWLGEKAAPNFSGEWKVEAYTGEQEGGSVHYRA